MPEHGPTARALPYKEIRFAAVQKRELNVSEVGQTHVQGRAESNVFTGPDDLVGRGVTSNLKQSYVV